MHITSVDFSYKNLKVILYLLVEHPAPTRLLHNNVDPEIGTYRNVI
jgi:hypothetical protein